MLKNHGMGCAPWLLMYKFRSQSIFAFSALALSLGLLSSCKSSTEESTPANYESETLSLEQRVEIYEKVEERSSKFKKAAQKVGAIVNAVRSGAGFVMGEDSYTTLDMALDIHDAFSGRLPETIAKKSGTYIDYSTLRLPSFLQTEDCKEIKLIREVQLDTSYEVAGINYAMNSCENPEAEYYIASLTWYQGAHFDIHTSEIQAALGSQLDGAKGRLEEEFDCEFETKSEEDYYDWVSVSCSSLQAYVGDSVLIDFTDFFAANHGSYTYVSAKADVIEEGTLKAYLGVLADSAGSFDVRVIRIRD